MAESMEQANQAKIQANQVRIAVLEKDVVNFSVMFEKFDQTLDRLADISNSIKQLLAVHDTKIAAAEDLHHALKDTIYDHIRTDNDFHLEVRTELIKLGEANKDIFVRLDSIDNTLQKTNDRLSVFEKWRWIIIGGVVVMIVGAAVMLKNSSVLDFLQYIA